ncbi:MAG: hypothetical protein O7C68_02745, partial [Rickettsia endosymbiont of Ixodes ricinus]|nr:hypothetical protein [Rickettsia endosymbiont of Ixodes ricinus]
YPQNHEELRQIVTLLAARTNNNESNAKATIYLQSEDVKNFVAKITLPEKFFLQAQDFEILKEYSK